MAPVFKGLRMLVIFPIAGQPDWTREKVSGWIKNYGGALVGTLDDKVNLIACSPDVWDERGVVIEAAIAAKDGGQTLNIVDTDWLVQTLHETKKPRMAPFLLYGTKVAAKPDSEDKITATAIFHEYTEGHLDDRTRKQLEMEEKALENDKRTAARKKAQEEADAKMGSGEARRKAFADNNHIYVTAEQFKYEVMLARVVPWRQGGGEELQVVLLQIYESNSEPKRYTMCGQLAESNLRRHNLEIYAACCNWPTAKRCFAKAFFELTVLLWQEPPNLPKTTAGIDVELEQSPAEGQDEYQRFRTPHFVYIPSGKPPSPIPNIGLAE